MDNGDHVMMDYDVMRRRADLRITSTLRASADSSCSTSWMPSPRSGASIRGREVQAGPRS